MIPSPRPMPASPEFAPSTGATLVALDGRQLPLRATSLSGSMAGGYGRITLKQTFVNPHAEPLRVTYQVPLPSDGAVAGFRFRIGDLEIVGEIDEKRRARARFEDAIASGRTAALLEQDRSSLFSQEVGNIPPGAEVVVELAVDQKLRWIADAELDRGGWEWRFPTVVAPRYLGATGRVADGGRIAVDVADRTPPVTVGLALEIAEPLAAGCHPRSPSHTLALRHEAGVQHVALGDAAAALDRDLVVRWAVAGADVGVSLDVARPAEGHRRADSAFGLLTVVPPAIASTTVARDLVVLLDTSGSMHGEPLAQAKHVTAALIGSLGPDDTLELVEFSSSARRWRPGSQPMTHEARAEALAWLGRLSAGGGTEMRSGILAALEGLRAEAQRQVVVVTDGLIGFEEEIVAEVSRRLPRGSRVHTVGIGSAVNRSLTGPVARAGGGLEVICGIGEDPERAAARLVARTTAPIVVDLTVEGDALVEASPHRLPDLFAGAPALVCTELRPEGGTLRVIGRTETGQWATQVHVPATRHGDGREALATLFARERVEDLELRRAAGDRTVDETITALGLDYRIATRLTSWVAATSEAMVDPTAPSRSERVPQALPYGMSVEGLGLRAAAGPIAVGAGGAPPPMTSQGAPAPSGFARARRKMAAAPPAARRPAPMPAAAPSPPPPPRDDLADADDEIAAEALAEDTGAIEVAKEKKERGMPRRATPRPPAKGGPAGPATWSGRIVSTTPGRIVIQLVVPFATNWAPRGPVRIQLADGSTITASIDPSATTRPGAVGKALVLRLALAVGREPVDAVAVHLDNAGVPLSITLTD